MMSPEQKFKLVSTPAGGLTIMDSQYGETYKSQHAADLEARVVYFEPVIAKHEILPQLKGPFRLLEIGFGLGTNFRSTLAAFQQCPYSDYSLEYTTIDCSTSALEYYYTQVAPDPATQSLAFNGQYMDKNVRARFLRLDFLPALESLLEAGEFFHGIYFDPFSPKVNPEAWSPSIFTLCAKLCLPGSRLATYSVSRIAKDELNKAGFTTEKLIPPELLRKKSTLLAIKKGNV